jgi:hypothetical protein
MQLPRASIYLIRFANEPGQRVRYANLETFWRVTRHDLAERNGSPLPNGLRTMCRPRRGPPQSVWWSAIQKKKFRDKAMLPPQQRS